jgi:alanyl-tRNA synthetase
MKANELRRKYIEFFVGHGHTEIPSASVVPENDPSVLFTTAGMHPLVPYLMGNKHPAGNRLVDAQKCIRTGDIDEVGDATHLTFFEMLGNWSLGDYFKDESIQMSFEFLTQELGIPLEKLAVSVFAGDDDADFDQEAYDKWLSLGVDAGRIAKLDKNENWWPAGGKHTGPQGPDTEIFYWTGDEPAPASFQETAEDPHWVEIWNNVFMQFHKDESGALTDLAQKNVDTGMGLERTAAILQGKANVYDTELFTPILEAIEKVSGKTYAENERAMRIIADHVRSAVMMISDGVRPSNKDQGYILRRLLRRAVRQFLTLDVERDGLVPVAQVVIDVMGEAYPSVSDQAEIILAEVKTEEGKFVKTLTKGLREFEKMFAFAGHVSGDEAFKLYATYGFPLELTQELVREKGQEVDDTVFRAEFTKHQDVSRAGAAGKFAGGLADDSIEVKRLHTATHLLHQALRTVLGDHVEQKGSNITVERLRFDFSHGEKMTPEQKEEVEKIVNDQIQAAGAVSFEELSPEEAKSQGAIGLFDDKYANMGGKVKVYTMGDFSKEICGGPHVDNTSELGAFKIKKEEASSAGIRRIKAILG